MVRRNFIIGTLFITVKFSLELSRRQDSTKNESGKPARGSQPRKTSAWRSYTRKTSSCHSLSPFPLWCCLPAQGSRSTDGIMNGSCRARFGKLSTILSGHLMEMTLCFFPVVGPRADSLHAMQKDFSACLSGVFALRPNYSLW